jgi:glycosyltransferase involved in cell wall biosynthesis
VKEDGTFAILFHQTTLSLSTPFQALPAAELPLVSVICLCYNQGRFVQEALWSVVNQTYSNVELIIVDDGSTDDSVSRINEFLVEFPAVTFLPMNTNFGMCAAFNRGLKQAGGEFVIDLAGDDVLLPDRIKKQVEAFSRLDPSWGVVFTDAGIIDEHSRPAGNFYRRGPDGAPDKPVPSGDVYTRILRSYFICTPTMMSRRAVYDDLGGYDESLCYEDFDFWVRSSRTYKYFFLDKVLTLKRRCAGSDSTKWYRRRQNPHLASTLAVCEKAYNLNRIPAEHQALAHSVRYHFRQAIFTENFHLASSYAALLAKVGSLTPADKALLLLARHKISLFRLYQWYLQRNLMSSKKAII